MLSWLTNAWRVPELRRRLLFTAGVLAVYRLGSWVPAPGVDQKALAQFFGHGGGSGGVLQLLNLFSGSALSRIPPLPLQSLPFVTTTRLIHGLALAHSPLSQ